MLVFVVLLAVALFFAALPWAAGAQGQGQDRPGIVTIVGGDPAVGTGLSASLSDLDTVSGTPTWQWSRSGTRRGIYADIDGSTSASYTPVEADKAFFLRVTVSYNDGHGTNKTASFTTLLPVGVGTNSLVKNTGQGDRNGRVVRHPYARFVTGDNPGGYALTSVGIKSWSWVGPYDAAVKEVLDGNRVGRDVAWLRPRVPPVGGRLNWFDAAPGVTLEPNTTYWLYHCCLQQPELTSSYDEDSGAAHGWSIDNLYGGDNLGHPIVRHDLVPVIAIEGYALLGPPGPPLGLSATAGTDSLTLSWSQPGSLGHRPVTKYQVRSKHTADDEYGEWTDVGTGVSLTAAVTGLGGGNHVVQVRAVNDQGAGAEARLEAATLRPGVSSVRVSSTPGYASAGHRDTFGSDDTIVISVAFTAAVTVTGSPTFTFVLGDADAAATYSGGTGTDRLTFSYDVAATDSDSDGISWAANQIALGADDSIVAAGDASLAATIIHAAQSALARTRVDGGVTPNQPAQFAAETATLSVRENAAPGVVGTVSASDPEGDGMIYWTNIIHERSEESDAFYRDFYADDGEISLKRSANLDYESGTRYAIYIDTSDCRDRRGTREYNPAGPVAPPGAPYCRRDDRLAVTIEVVPASDPAPPQTQNVDPPQTQNVDPPQTQNVDPPQTQTQTQNVDPPQTQNPPQTQSPPQTQDLDPAQVGGSSVDVEGSEQAQTQQRRFSDVAEGAYYADAVDWMAANGVTVGCAADMFCPAQTTTRAQFVTFLWRAAGEPEPSLPDAGRFSDVDTSDYFWKATDWAAQTGVTRGCGDGADFCPDRPVTRAQVAVFLHRFSGEDHDAAGATFKDVAPDAYYFTAVEWLAARRITRGCAADLFCPNGSASRAHVAVFLYNYFSAASDSAAG